MAVFLNTDSPMKSKSGAKKLNSGPNETLDTCPYNGYHVVLGQKKERHVVACRHAYMEKNSTPDQGVELFKCKYNDSHWIPYVEVIWHQERCPQRNEFPGFEQDPFNNYNPNTPMGRKLLESMKVDELECLMQDREMLVASGKEDWTLDARAWELSGTDNYNPVGKIRTEGVPWCPTNLTKVGRREFRQLHSELGRIGRRTYQPNDSYTQEGKR